MYNWREIVTSTGRLGLAICHRQLWYSLGICKSPVVSYLLVYKALKSVYKNSIKEKPNSHYWISGVKIKCVLDEAARRTFWIRESFCGLPKMQCLGCTHAQKQRQIFYPGKISTVNEVHYFPSQWSLNCAPQTLMGFYNIESASLKLNIFLINISPENVELVTL